MKRSGRSPDAVSSGSRSGSGSKRSVKDRLGTRADDSSEARSRRKHKRQKGKQNQESCHRNSSNDKHVTKGDLRFKLMEKKDPPTDVDLRDKLSSKPTVPPSDGKRSRPPEATISITTKKSTLETGEIYDDERQHVEDRAYESGRQSRREHREVYDDDNRQNVEDRAYESERQSRRELRGSWGGQGMQELVDNVGGQRRRELRDSDRGQILREFGDSPRRQNMRELGDNVCNQNVRELGEIDGRQIMGEGRGIVGRQSTRELRDGVGRQNMVEPVGSYNVERQSRQEPSVYSGERRSTQEPWDTYDTGTPIMVDTRDRYEHGRQGVSGQIPSRIGCDLPAVGHARTSYPSWASDSLTRRSPDRMSCSSMTRTFSPEINAELQRRAFIRTYDDGNSSVYRRNEVPSPHTVAGPAIYMNQPPLHALPPIHAAPVPFTAQFPQSSGAIMRILNPGDQPTVIGFLQSLGLEKYAINFQHEEVDFHTLRQMSDSDLKELHIPMGPRKKILQALLPPPRR